MRMKRMAGTVAAGTLAMAGLGIVGASAAHAYSYNYHCTSPSASGTAVELDWNGGMDFFGCGTTNGHWWGTARIYSAKHTGDVQCDDYGTWYVIHLFGNQEWHDTRNPNDLCNVVWIGS